MEYFRKPDKDRFTGIFSLHEDAMRAYARALLPDWDTVDEVMQESSIVMWKKFDQIRSDDGFLPWAKVIIRFEALKVSRKFARDKLCFREDLMDLISREDRETDSAQGLKKEMNALQSCLEKLSPPQKELVLLPYSEHGAVNRLARKTNRSVNSYYKKIGRLREKLTNCIELEIGGRTQ